MARVNPLGRRDVARRGRVRARTPHSLWLSRAQGKRDAHMCCGVQDSDKVRPGDDLLYDDITLAEARACGPASGGINLEFHHDA